MKKRSITILSVIVVIGVLGGMWYHHMYGKTYYYGQVDGKIIRTEKAPAGYPNVYYYKVDGWNKDGKHQRMEVGSTGGHKFVKGHYIKVGWSNAKDVVDFARVSYNQIPKAAQEKIDAAK